MKYNIIEHPMLKEVKGIKKRIAHGEYNIQKYKTYSEFLSRSAIDLADSILQSNQLPNMKASSLLDTAMIHLLLNKIGTHYFIEDISTYDFLANTEIKNISQIATFFENKTLEYPIKLFQNPCAKYYNFYIHSLSKLPAIHVAFFMLGDQKILAINQKDNIYNVDINKYDMQHIKLSFNDRTGMNPETYKEFISNEDYVYGRLDFSKDNEITIKTVNTVVNLILYLQAFPEHIIDGAPKGQVLLYDPNRSQIVRTSEEVIDRSGITPHFRSGHFRHLESDVYTKKKGQVVFVRSTFVSGHAKTVESNIS